MTDPKAIAAELSEAQKRAMLAAQDRNANGVWHPAGYYLYADKRVRLRLNHQKLIADYLSPTQRLTPLGLAVRKALQEQSR